MRAGNLLALGVVAVAISASTVSAQRTAGFVLGAHTGYSMGSKIEYKSFDGVATTGSDETESAINMGLLAGYDFGNGFMLFGRAERSNQEVKNSTVDISVRHLGLGVRWLFAPMQAKKMAPYLAVELGQRTTPGEDCDASGCADFSYSGYYGGVGVGTLYEFRPAWAFDGSLNLSSGSFSDYEVGTANGEMKTDGVTAIRLHVGATWFFGRMPKRP